MAQHDHRADNLAERTFKADKIGALFDITEEAVEHLFNLHQIVLYFLGNLPDKQFFLRLSGHFVQQRYFGTRRQWIPGHAGVDTSNRHIDLMSKIRTEALIICLCVLSQQNRSSHLHGHSVGMAAGVVRQPVCSSRYCLPQPAEIGMSELPNQHQQRPSVLPEHR